MALVTLEREERERQREETVRGNIAFLFRIYMYESGEGCFCVSGSRIYNLNYRLTFKDEIFPRGNPRELNKTGFILRFCYCSTAQPKSTNR